MTDLMWRFALVAISATILHEFAQDWAGMERAGIVVALRTVLPSPADWLRRLSGHDA